MNDFVDPVFQLVSKDSAIIDGSKLIRHDKPHRSLQRFRSVNDEGYRDLLFYLKAWAMGVGDNGMPSKYDLQV